MTRLQRRNNSSCDCGKTTKESRSFVTKNKTYETRSGVQKNQEAAFNGCPKKLSANTLNLRGRVYIKKMDGPLVTLPVRNGKINGEKVKLLKSSKICSKNSKNVVSNGDTKILDSSFEKIITANLKVDFIDINGSILQKEDSTISNGIPNEFVVKTLNETNKETKIQNGDFVNNSNDVDVLLNGNDNCLSPKEIKTEIVSNVATKTCVNNEMNGYYEPDEIKELDTTCINSETVVKRDKIGRKNKRTRFELFIKESCENLGLGILTDKRTRKAPISYSPDTERKIKLQDCTVVEPQSPIQCLTKKGLPFKKKGRKPRPKGPIKHYLDVYVKNKSTTGPEQEQNFECKGSVKTETEQLKQDVVTVKETLSQVVESYNQTDKKTVQSIDIQKDHLPSASSDVEDVDLPFQKLCPKPVDKKRKKKDKKVGGIKKRKTVNKLEAEEYSSPIVFVLGYRVNMGDKEMLVQFENGTSNWIPYSDKEFDISEMKDFYRHTDQEPSVVNRLGYRTLFPSSSSSDNELYTTTNSSESELSSVQLSEESDCDDVFFRTVPSLACQLPLKGLKPSSSPGLLSYTEVNSKMLSEGDLNELCNYVMSSKHAKLYPFELSQEVVIKVDDEFVSIFLKCFNHSKEHLKRKESFNMKTCEKLINVLEDCSVNINCKVVVISGIEDYFSSNSVFEKLLKKTAALEGRKYEEDVSMLRYNNDLR